MLLAPHSVVRSNFLKRHEIIACQVLPLKNETHFPSPLAFVLQVEFTPSEKGRRIPNPSLTKTDSGGIDQVRLGARRCGAKSTQQSQVHLSTELGPPGGLEPQEPKIRQLAGSKL